LGEYEESNYQSYRLSLKEILAFFAKHLLELCESGINIFNIKGKVMKKLSVLLFALLIAACSKQPAILNVASCAFDAPINNSQLALNSSVTFGGWAYDSFSQTSPESVFVQLASEDGKNIKTIEAKRGTKRPDVASVKGVPKAIDSGFDVIADLNGLPAGKYEATLIQKNNDDLLIQCGNPFFLTIN